MKTIKNIIALGAISFIGILGTLNYSYARDSIDWGDLDVKYTYDYANEELDIRVSVEESSRPDDRYSARFEIDGDDYNRDFSYDSSKDELYFEYSVKIDSDDIQDEYSMDIRVTNETDDDLEYEDVLRGTVNNYMDWDNLEMKSEYNSSSQYIRVDLTLNNVDENPNDTHYSYFKLDGKTYSAAFRYSSSEDKYYATHTIYIDRDDIEDEYDYELTIKNRNYNIVYEDEGELNVDGYTSRNNSYYDRYDRYNKNDNKFDWEDMTMTNYYNPNAKELNVVFIVPNVEKNPSKNYFVVLDFNQKEYTKKLTYLEDQDRLYANMTFNVGLVKDFYYVDYSVITSSTTVFLREDVRMNINKGASSSKPSSSNYVIKKYNTDAIAQRIIDIAEERYTYSEDKIYYLERISNKLENFFGTPQFKTVISGVNARLKAKINDYKEVQYYEEDLFDLKYDDLYY